MEAEEVQQAIGLPDLLAVAEEIGVSPEQTYGLWAGDLPILLISSDALANLTIPIVEVRWLDERVFCKYVHDALQASSGNVVTARRLDTLVGCPYLEDDNMCLLNGQHTLRPCAFHDPMYNWDWVVTHTKLKSHHEGDASNDQEKA